MVEQRERVFLSDGPWAHRSVEVPHGTLSITLPWTPTPSERSEIDTGTAVYERTDRTTAVYPVTGPLRQGVLLPVFVWVE